MQQNIRATATPGQTALPDALQAALAENPAAAAAFNAMSASHRQEYVSWIAEAKQPQTRARRAAKAVAMILAP